MQEELNLLNLVKDYFNVCNTALSQRKGGLIFESVMGVLNEFVTGDSITLRVVDESGVVLGCYRTRFVDEQFTPVIEGKLTDPDARFILRRDFLEEVSLHRNSYVLNPEQLDWSWLRNAKLGRRID